MEKKHLLLTGLTPPAALRAAMWAGALAFALASGPGRSVAADLYVATNGTGDGSSWANATNSIQGAIDAIEGTYPTNTVWVSNGVYAVGGRTNYPSGTVTNRVAIWKAITVRSANNDPTNTIIRGTWASDGNTNGVDAVRCVYMTNGSSLIGFMLTNGATLAYAAPDNENYHGGGVWCSSTNTVISNCVIAGNAAGLQAAGASYGTLYNCAITGNRTWKGSSGANAGGTYASTLYNCILTGNSTYTAGGAYGGKLYNCTIVSNSTIGVGGGARAVTLYNCTIVSNSAGASGGGVYISTLYNCISWDNNKVDFQPTAYYSCGVGYTNGGSVSGNITNNPLFVASGTGNYRLSKYSPCINTGSNSAWMADPADVRSKDLDGHSRIDKFNGRVDMGCYEDLPSGTIIRMY